MKAENINIISDYNVDNLVALFNNDHNLPACHAKSTPYGQVQQSLISNSEEIWSEETSATIIWTSLETVSPSFKLLTMNSSTSLDEIENDLKEYCDLIIGSSKKTKNIFIPFWINVFSHRGVGPYDFIPGKGISGTILYANNFIRNYLKDFKNIFFFNTESWISAGRYDHKSEKLWYMSKTLYSKETYQAAISNFKSTIRSLKGEVRKLLVLDLDNTLWGGIVGDDGYKNLNIGGHNPIGEAFADFQRSILALKNKGILLAICSKNDEKIALHALENNNEMILKINDFSSWQINWDDKAKNMQKITEDLNLGLQSAVFLDDSPFERGIVREMLPEVFVPEMPQNPYDYRKFLSQLDCFDVADISDEDRARSENYKLEKERKKINHESDSFETWINKLELKVNVENLNENNIKRATQLLNKTNQMNLRTRRLSENELISWDSKKTNQFWCFNVSDRFGEYGLTGLFGATIEGDSASVTDFVLSCRVMGRGVENAMLGFIFQQIKRDFPEVTSIVFIHKETEKNQPIFEYLLNSALTNQSDSISTFIWNFDKNFITLPSIQVSYANELSV
tara:strand:- start:90 stop:1793 length:1704 start_codon:yes stop_codon:yes gene_type:complete